MPQRLRLPAVLVGALVVAEAAVLLMRPREKYPREQVEPRAYFSAQELEKAKAFRNGQFLLFAGQTALELIVLVVAVRRAPRVGRRPVVTGALTAAALVGVTTAVALPLRAVARERAKDVGLVTQSWGGWAVDVVKGTAISAGMAAGGGAILVLVIGRFGRRWWIPGAAAITGFAVVFTFLGPVVLDPVFNKFTPLSEGRVRSDVLALARQADVKVGQVYEVDASRRTTAANAYVTGLGSTKRVVLYDTLIKDFSPEELRLVVAHELGHVHYDDVPRGLLWLALVAPASLFAVQRMSERLSGGRGGVPATLPALLLSIGIVSLLVGTVSNQLSRRVEARADTFSLKLTGAPAPFIGFERRITIKNVSDPDPPDLLTFLLATHPPAVERIGAAVAYEEGAR